MSSSGMDHSPERPALGLRVGGVVVRDYDSRWPAEFDRERAALAVLLDGVVERIEHVGSTAVVGLAAKPLIDIALGFSDPALLDEGRARLLAAGYEDRGDLGEKGGVVVTKGSPSERTHILHLVLVESDQWRRFLTFRDALRADPTVRDEYATLKKALAGQFPGDREAYTAGKAPFVDGVTRRASS
jgi:GrpB-like predicted nucleotidyltransferase (UPF0157 family)